MGTAAAIEPITMKHIDKDILSEKKNMAVEITPEEIAGIMEKVISEKFRSKELLGELLFFDTSLSEPKGQSCAACHDSGSGWTGPETDINAHGAVYEGAVPERFGNRKPPSSAYAPFSPVFHYDNATGTFVGGNFWDGRATGEKLGNPAADQAQGPFLNPLEQNNPRAAAVVNKVCNSRYAGLFKEVWGSGACDNVDTAYNDIALSIAAYEASHKVSQFSSKYDLYLAGKARLNKQEKLGLELFEGKANCAACHPSKPGPYSDKPLFTDFTYDNIGTPKNPENPFYTMPPQFNPDGANFIDYGLGGYLKSAGYPEDVYTQELGKMKVPTLRNVDKRPYPEFVKAYSHNGFFKSLKEIVHFYNTRDVKGASWPAPEVQQNINKKELGNLGLTDEEENAIVAFLKTLSDGYALCN